MRNNFSSFKDLVLNKTDICLLSETKIDDSFRNSQFFAESYRMFAKDRNINESISGKSINSYDFKEGSEIKVLEFSISNKKWLLPGNYKQCLQNQLTFINKIIFQTSLALHTRTFFF